MRNRYEEQRWIDWSTKGATDKEEDKAFDSHWCAIKTHTKSERAENGRACTSNSRFK